LRQVPEVRLSARSTSDVAAAAGRTEALIGTVRPVFVFAAETTIVTTGRTCTVIGTEHAVPSAACARYVVAI
jgi:hypothetical protein